MAHRVIFVRIAAVLTVLAILTACAPTMEPTPEATATNEGAVLTAGNFAGALTTEDYDEAFSFLTPETQAALGDATALEARFGSLCETELDRYRVQMQPTDTEGIIINTGTLTCEDGTATTVLIVTENTGPGLWLVRDFQVNELGTDE